MSFSANAASIAQLRDPGGAARAKVRRSRRHNRQRVYQLPLPEDVVAHAVVEAGLVTAADSDLHASVEVALTRWVAARLSV
jgi:hypothetical protein